MHPHPLPPEETKTMLVRADIHHHLKLEAAKRNITLYDLHNAILSRYLEAGCPNLNPEVP